MNNHYIGDGVYVEQDKLDPTMIRLYTDRGDTQHYIYLERNVLDNLLEWLERNQFTNFRKKINELEQRLDDPNHQMGQ